MIQKWIGAALVFAGCSSVGFLMAAGYRREEKLLMQTKRFLEKLECELSCRVSTLPQLCHMAFDCGDPIRSLYTKLEEELDRQVMPDVNSCMQAAIRKQPQLPASVRSIHEQLGMTLGQFDLQGQLQQIGAVRAICEDNLSRIRDHRDEKLKSYQTLGLCAGAALALLFL